MEKDIQTGSTDTLWASILVENAHDMPTVKTNSKQPLDLCINKKNCEKTDHGFFKSSSSNSYITNSKGKEIMAKCIYRCK